MYIDWEEYWPFIVIGVLVLLFVLWIVDVSTSKTIYRNGIIVDMAYKPETNSTGVGYQTGSSGNGGPVITNHHQDEKWLIMVRCDSKILTVDSKPELYYTKRVNDKIEFSTSYGRWTGINYGHFAVK